MKIRYAFIPERQQTEQSHVQFRCPDCGTINSIDRDQFRGIVPVACSKCDFNGMVRFYKIAPVTIQAL